MLVNDIIIIVYNMVVLEIIILNILKKLSIMKNLQVYNCHNFSVVEANKNRLENKLWLFMGYKLILIEQEAKSDAGKNIKTTRAL